MGCHTWIYKRLSKVPRSKIKELCDHIISEIDGYWIITENPHTYASEMVEYYKTELKETKTESEILIDREKTVRDYRQWQEKLKSYRRKDYIDYLKKYKSFAQYKKYKGEYYILIGTDVFRFSHYTDRKFKSSDKLIKYFSKKDWVGCYIISDTLEIPGKSKELIEAIHKTLDPGDTIIEFG